MGVHKCAYNLCVNVFISTYDLSVSMHTQVCECVHVCVWFVWVCTCTGVWMYVHECVYDLCMLGH